MKSFLSGTACFLAAAIFLVFNTLNAQNTPKKKSAKKEVPEVTVQTPMAEDAFYYAVNHMDSLDVEEVKALFNKSIDFAIKEKNGKVELNAREFLGILYLSRQNYDKAIEYFQQAINRASELHNVDRVAEYTNDLKSVYNKTGNTSQVQYYDDIRMKYIAGLAFENEAEKLINEKKYQDALSKYNEAFNNYSLAKNEILCAKTLEIISILQSKSDSLKASSQVVPSKQKESAILAKKDAAKTIATSLLAEKTYNHGVDAYNVEKMDEAFAIFTKALVLAQKEKNDEIEWQCQNYLGGIYASRKEYLKAIDCFQKASKVASYAGFKMYLTNLTGNIGAMYNNYGNSDSANKYFTLASYYEQAAIYEHIADSLMNIGKKVESINQYGQAYLQYKKTSNEVVMAKMLDFLARLYYENGQCLEAVTRFEWALDHGLEQQKDKQDIIDAFSMFGDCYMEHGDYDNTIKVWRKAGALADIKFGMPLSAAVMTKKLGELMLYTLNKPADAAGYFNTALGYAEEAKDMEQKAIIHFKLGTTYDLMGRYDGAISEYKRAFEVADSAKLYRWQMIALLNLGSLYTDIGQLTDAEKQLKAAEAVLLKHPIDDKANLGSLYLMLGRLAKQKKQDDVALVYYQKALNVSKNEPTTAITVNINIGAIYEGKGQLAKAIECYNKANSFILAGKEKEGALNASKQDEFYVSEYLGMAYVKTKEYAKAESYLKEAIAQIDVMSANIGDREFLNGEKSLPYMYLVKAYIAQNKAKEAFDVLEQLNMRYFLKQLAKKKGAKPAKGDVEEFRKTISRDAAYIAYTQTVQGSSAILYADNNALSAFEVQDSTIGKLLKGNVVISAKTAIEKRRGMRKTTNNETIKLDNFNTIIEYYRSILVSGSGSDIDKKMLKEIGKALYNMVFSQIETYIKDKKELYIMPGSILAYVPFETFVMPDGRYLIEKYEIHYVQSLAVQKMLENRKYPEIRNSILAFGNPVYGQIQYKNQEEEAQAFADYHAKNGGNIYEDIFGNYIAYGYGPDKWESLPATQVEVDALKIKFKDAQVYAGVEAGVKNLKQLSAAGKLKKYSMLHFATHGLVIPDKPELSALVLSQVKGSEDIGYLSMVDIANLDLHADFVNLSACETGLGKYYMTEGVVGLSQAFMLAGANAVSVSLWSVQDESTKEFMTKFYTLIDSGMPYATAMSETKRSFIKSGKYANPLYWAPFVYYGLSKSDFKKYIAKYDSEGNELLVDIEGNEYHTVKIGNQVWTLDNLRTTKFNDGTDIPVIQGKTLDWESKTSPRCCVYDGWTTVDGQWKRASEVVGIRESFGLLYNWSAVNSGKLAPLGWHIPSEAEWDSLESYLVKNGYMKIDAYRGNQVNFESSLVSKRNLTIAKDSVAYGFFYNLGGIKRIESNIYSECIDIDISGFWWTSDYYYGDDVYVPMRAVYLRDNEFNHMRAKKVDGHSVRLVKDK